MLCVDIHTTKKNVDIHGIQFWRCVDAKRIVPTTVFSSQRVHRAYSFSIVSCSAALLYKEYNIVKHLIVEVA